MFVLDCRAEGQGDDGLDLVDLVGFWVGVDYTCSSYIHQVNLIGEYQDTHN